MDQDQIDPAADQAILGTADEGGTTDGGAGNRHEDIGSALLSQSKNSTEAMSCECPSAALPSSCFSCLLPQPLSLALREMCQWVACWLAVARDT